MTANSLRRHLESMLSNADEAPTWPPDLYAVCASVLRVSGTYTQAVDLVDGPGEGSQAPSWPDGIRNVGKQWREMLAHAKPPRNEPHPQVNLPEAIEVVWRRLVDGGTAQCDLGDLSASAVTDLTMLACIADEACKGIGIVLSTKLDGFAQWTERALAESGGCTLCVEVPMSRGRVLPKQHTPQRGVTLRSLTHHLAFVPPSGVSARWHLPMHLDEARRSDLDLLNVLVLPWPLLIDRKAFRTVDRQGGVPRGSPFRFFELSRASSADERARFRAYVNDAVKKALEHADNIDVIVFPELALDLPLLDEARTIAQSQRAILVAGVAVAAGETLGEGKRSIGGPANVACMNFTGLFPPNTSSTELHQRKHHRWCLDERQVKQYGLAGRIPASKDSWEHIHISPREVNFWTIDKWMTMTVLVCEDLARQDPVAEVIRSVGPNLVFALLMDGPQLPERWGARYGSILAEDPGSSVLTITSLGMAALSQPQQATAPARNRVVALWRDAMGGLTEISLEAKQTAALLTIVCESEQEWTLDGRGDGYTAHFPVLTGWVGLEAVETHAAPIAK